jgi:uncharacterized protein Usg
MGRNKDLRKRLTTLEKRLVEHYEKLEAQRAKDLPDQGTIDYWKKEIRGRLKEINYLRKKLGLPEREF